MHSIATITFACVTTAIVAGEPERNAAWLTQVLAADFKFQPVQSAPMDVLDTHEPEEGTVVLPEFKVTSRNPRGLESALKERRLAIETEKFSWKHGGTIVKLRSNVELKFKYNPEHNGIDLLSISW
jgi:hypothetical protein